MDSDDYEYDQKGKKVTKESLGIKKGDNKETMINKMLKGMKIGDFIDGEDLGFLGSGVSYAIDNIERVSNTVFKVNSTTVGSFKISDDATITLIKNVTIKANYMDNGVEKTGSFTGIKVITRGLPLTKYNGKSYNGYNINGNESQTVSGKNLIRWVQ